MNTITPDKPLVLASASPRRKHLLEQIGLPFVVRPSRIPEGGPMKEPSADALELAVKKALAVSAAFPGQWVLGADTVVVLGERILGKPKDPEDALAMLNLLSGREHQVITAFSVLNPAGEVSHKEAVSTAVRFRRLRKKEIEAYIATGEPFGKAGGYAIQGMGAFMVDSIEGSYTNVVGLPLCTLIQALLALEALETFPLVEA
jgi:septum formation protein